MLMIISYPRDYPDKESVLFRLFFREMKAGIKPNKKPEPKEIPMAINMIMGASL